MSKQNGNQPPSAITAVTQGLEARAAILKSFLHDKDGEDVTRFINEVRLAVISSPYLQACTPDSILRACQEVAKFRRGIGAHGAWLVPYGKDCTIVWDYRALMDMARDDGVLDIDAGIVKEGDDFDWQKGTEEFLRHRPDPVGGGNVTHAYAIATLKHGIKKFVVLDRTDIDRIRARSRSGDKGPWVSDYGAMAMKTAIRQLVKLLPRSRGKDSLHRAVEFEERGHDMDTGEVTPPAVPEDRRLPVTSGAQRAKEVVRARLEAEEKISDSLESHEPAKPAPEEK